MVRFFTQCSSKYYLISKIVKVLVRTKIYQSMKPDGECRKGLINVFKCALRKPWEQFNGENRIFSPLFFEIGFMMQFRLASDLLSSCP